MAVQTKMKISLIAEETQDVGGLGSSAKMIHEVAQSLAFASGVDAGDTFFAYSQESITVTTAGQAYDLVGSTLQSLIDGTTDLDLDEIVAIFVENTGGSETLLVGAGSNPLPGIVETPATHRTTVLPGGFHLYYFGSSGQALTGGSADVLTLDVAANTTTARLWLVGR